jgi:hypothetical protein
MRTLFLAVAALLLTPSLARAEATLTMRELPLRGARTLASDSPARFDMVGLHWRGSGSVAFRTRSSAGRWSSWHTAAPEAEDLPNAGSAEAKASHGWRLGNPYWTGAATAIRYRVHGQATRLRAYYVWSPVDSLPPRRLSVAGSPPIIPRASWGANESIRRASPRYANTLQFSVVHHTAGTNSYSPSQSAAIVRGIEVYHVKGNGWNDIGYNFLIDRYGQVFEGRYGGIDKNVIGAHAEGFNTGSVGVALIGTYTSSPPPPVAQTALVNLLAWRLDIAHVDPRATVPVISGGNARFAAGTPVFLRTVSGHRDTGFTTCPGNALFAQLGLLAARVGTTGLPKLYGPTVKGQLGGAVVFRAKLTAALPWTVTVTDATGLAVASGSGTGTSVEWTWDSSHAASGRYAWTIAAGSDVTPASGFVGAAPVPLALKKTGTKPASFSPNGDGVADRTTVSYTLTSAATVTATLRSAVDGHQLSTLFSGRQSAGVHTLAFTAAGVPDGRYAIVISASDGTTTVSTSIPVAVDRTLGAFTATPAFVSPNGDGRNDALTVGFSLSSSADVRVDVEQASRVAATVFAGSLPAGARSFTWNGVTAKARARDGVYAVTVSVTTVVGTTRESLLFRIDKTPPRIAAISFWRLVFRISERAKVTLVANGRRHVLAVHAGVFSLHLGRPARRVTVSAVDAAGNVSRILRYP